jgi:hypothetical protein
MTYYDCVFVDRNRNNLKHFNGPYFIRETEVYLLLIVNNKFRTIKNINIPHIDCSGNRIKCIKTIKPGFKYNNKIKDCSYLSERFYVRNKYLEKLI